MGVNISSKRIFTFDYMRGYFMLCIVVNHLFLFPSAWQILTGRALLWVSAAEGFFFLSGIMVGLVRGNEYRQSSLRVVSKKLLNRAWALYLVNIVVVVVSVLLARDLLVLNPTVGVKTGFPAAGSVLGLIFKAATFQLSYGWADFLSYYVVFLVIAIPVLWLIKKVMWFLVLGLSVLAWFEPRIIDFGVFDKYYFYWQLYFFFGLVIGYYYHAIIKWFESLNSKTKSSARNAFVWVFIVSFILNWILIYISKPWTEKIPAALQFLVKWGGSLHTASEPFLYADRAGVLRPIVFGVWILGMYFLFQRFEGSIKRRFDWILGEFGRQSLRTYVVSSIVALILPAIFTTKGFVLNTVVTFVIVLIIVKLIKSKPIQRIVPN